MDQIKVVIDREEGLISCYNTGKGIPVEIHSKEKIYIPELIFGELLTSSNYDDEEKKVTGGRNGYGAKLANIYSTEFIVETADAKNKTPYVSLPTIDRPEMANVFAESPSVRISVHFLAFLVPA